MKTVLRWVILLSLVLLPSLVLAQDDEDSEIYEDPNGLYTVPVPTNWSVEEADGYAVLTEPDDGVIVYVMAVEAESAEEGIENALALVFEDFDLEEVQNQDVPSSPGIEETVVIAYTNDDQSRIVQAVSLLYEGNAYVLVVDILDISVAQRRNAQIQIIASGFTITALEQTSLVDVEPLPIDEEMLDELAAYIEDVIERLAVPGVSVAIVQDGEIIYAEGFGVRSLESDEPVTADTRMMIGSVTKSMTTMMMATLVDDGLMEWDTLVVEILPTFEVADDDLTQTITMRNLVCACTGVPRRDLEFVFNSGSLTAENVVESLAGFEFFTDFGEAFQYSNQMVATGGYVATIAAGGEYGSLYEDYLAAMDARVFDPIDMRSTTFVFDEVSTSDDFASPHGASLEGEYVTMPLEAEQSLTTIAPAGAVWSTAHDMGRYLITELNRGESPDSETVVSEENLTETWQPQIDVSAGVTYGLGWFLEDYNSVQVIQHGGNTFGFSADLAFLPDVGVGIVILANQQASIAPQAIRYRFLELLFGQEMEFDVTIDFVLDSSAEAMTEIEERLTDVPESETEALTGTYSNDVLGEVTLTYEDGVFTFDAGEFQSEVIYLLPEDEGDEAFYVLLEPPLAGTTLSFDEDDDGSATFTIGEGVVAYTFTREE